MTEQKLTNRINIGDSLWHPCSMDIIEHKVTSITHYEKFTHYSCKSVHNVGACGKIEVILDEHEGKLRFVKLIDEESIEYSSGLQDFVEGSYYANKRKAELSFYEQQRIVSLSNVEEKKRWYADALKRHKQVELLVRTIRESLEEIEK